jgi:hypothetical protein
MWKSQHLHQLRHDAQSLLVLHCKLDGVEVGVLGLEGDLYAPGLTSISSMMSFRTLFSMVSAMAS